MSWAIEAVEKAAMARAYEQINKQPQTFRFHGYSPEQLLIMVRYIERSVDIGPISTPHEISVALDCWVPK